MTEFPRPVPAIAWVLVCLLALGIGYYLGERQNSAVWEHINRRPAIALGLPPNVVTNETTVAIDEHTISNLVRDAGRSIVSIEVDARSQSSEFPHVVPGLLPSPQTRVVGSGIIIRPDGYVVTSNHVIGMDNGIKVVLADGKSLPARLLGRDWLSGAAILKVQAANLPAARIGDSSRLEPGDWVVSIGSPMRLDHSVSLGIVSAVNRQINEARMPGVGLIQTDAAMNPGSSGGGLFNLHGEVVGMNSAVRRDAQGISFAVPVDIVMQAAEMLIHDGEVAHAYMGIYMGNAREAGVEHGKDGVYVLAVRQGPAMAAGMRTGDLIEAMDDQPVASIADVRRALLNHKPGDSLKISIVQNQKPKVLSLTLAQSPNDAP